jgi:hypothetical protein
LGFNLGSILKTHLVTLIELNTPYSAKKGRKSKKVQKVRAPRRHNHHPEPQPCFAMSVVDNFSDSSSCGGRSSSKPEIL